LVYRPEGLVYNEFRPGSIHEKRFFPFWRDELRAPEWILKVLENGYSIPFKALPGPYFERNNKSARDNMQIVRQIVADMLAKGIVRIAREKPLVVSPLGLVSKVQDDGSMKHRLVFDASRHVNTFIDLPHVRLNHLDKALELTMPNDYQTVFDLSSAYYHISIEEQQRKFLGAAFQNSNGENVFFEYCHLPFGISSAVHIITKIWKPITQYLNKRGIRNTIYIDDGRILAESPVQAREYATLTYEVITKAGWAIEKLKSDSPDDAAKVKNYLGFIIDSKEMMVSSPVTKLLKIEELVKDTLRRQEVPVKHLAKIMGKIISIEPSHGLLARVATRSGYAAIAQHTEENNWKGNIWLQDNVRKELAFLMQVLQTRNGSPIKSSLTEVRIETIIPNPVARKDTIPNHDRGQTVVVSDASDAKAFVYELTRGSKTILSCNFDTNQRKLSSGARELLSIAFTVKQWNVQKRSGFNVYWVTDSENVVSFIKKGSRRPEIQAILFELVELCHQMKINIEPIHLKREDPRIQLADEGTRHLDSDNWSIDFISFKWFQDQFQLDVDLFADNLNKRLPRFCSLYYSEGTEGVDAFASCWKEKGHLWLCPPVSLLIKVAQRIRNAECKGILVLPVWETSSYFNLFFQNDLQPLPPFQLITLWHPYIIQNEEARKTPLFGNVPFQFAALKFDTTKDE
jgi:hypothetical protein